MKNIFLKTKLLQITIIATKCQRFVTIAQDRHAMLGSVCGFQQLPTEDEAMSLLQRLRDDRRHYGWLIATVLCALWFAGLIARNHAADPFEATPWTMGNGSATTCPYPPPVKTIVPNLRANIQS